MNFLIIYLLIINLLVFTVDCQNYPESPCSNIFSYMEFQNRVYGFLKVDNFQSNITNHLTVHCTSFGNPKLKLFRDRDSSTDDLIHGRPIFFELTFESSNKFPEIIEIKSNGRKICEGKDSKHIFTEQKIINFRMGPVTWDEVKYSEENQIQTTSSTTVRPTERIRQVTRPSTTTTRQPISHETRTCGSPSLELVQNGIEYKQEAMPWLTIILKKNKKNYLCAGSLISRKTVISAAHCFQDDQKNENYMIGLGVHDLSKKEDGAEYQDVDNIIVHHNYDKNKIQSFADIAIVILKQSVEPTKRIRSICLISNLNALLVQTGFVAGWGISDTERLDKPTYAKAQIVPLDNCLTSNYAFLTVTSNTTFCAGFRDLSGPCKGDSGSGLVFKIGNEWFLGGIVSQALYLPETTCKLDDYIVYTDATQYYNWIERNKVD